ncbi:Protein of unknown function [Gryllus bimaculatus]|nr:Protein of unknown function [Gryllus bimaculatus]
MVVPVAEAGAGASAGRQRLLLVQAARRRQPLRRTRKMAVNFVAATDAARQWAGAGPPRPPAPAPAPAPRARPRPARAAPRRARAPGRRAHKPRPPPPRREDERPRGDHAPASTAVVNQLPQSFTDTNDSFRKEIQWDVGHYLLHRRQQVLQCAGFGLLHLLFNVTLQVRNHTDYYLLAIHEIHASQANVQEINGPTIRKPLVQNCVALILITKEINQLNQSKYTTLNYLKMLLGEKCIANQWLQRHACIIPSKNAKN